MTASDILFWSMGIALLVLAPCVWIQYRAIRGMVGIMRTLADGYEWYGLELVLHVRGAVSRGTVYSYLSRLEDIGVVTSRVLPSGRRLYRMATPPARPRRMPHDEGVTT